MNPTGQSLAEFYLQKKVLAFRCLFIYTVIGAKEPEIKKPVRAGARVEPVRVEPKNEKPTIKKKVGRPPKKKKIERAVEVE